MSILSHHDEFENYYPYSTKNNQGDLISREALKKCAIPCEIHNGALTELCVPLYQIDNAQTIKFSLMPADETKEDAYKRGYERGKIAGILEANTRTQGEWARHDEWRNGEYIGGFYHINCPVEDGYYSKWEYNFCPNCGAEMRKGSAE